MLAALHISACGGLIAELFSVLWHHKQTTYTWNLHCYFVQKQVLTLWITVTSTGFENTD